MQNKLNITAALLAISLSSTAFAGCDVQSLDIKAPEQVELIKKTHDEHLIGMNQSYLMNSVDIDGDGNRDYLIIMDDKKHCNDHGCSFLGIKEAKDRVLVIRTGYVPVKDGKAQCDEAGKIVFYTSASK